MRAVTFTFSVSGDDVDELFSGAEREIRSLIGFSDEDIGDGYLSRFSVGYDMEVTKTEESDDDPLYLESNHEYVGHVTARIKDVR